MVSSLLGHQIKIITHNKYKNYKQEYKYTNQNEYRTCLIHKTALETACLIANPLVKKIHIIELYFF